MLTRLWRWNKRFPSDMSPLMSAHCSLDSACTDTAARTGGVMQLLHGILGPRATELATAFIGLLTAVHGPN